MYRYREEYVFNYDLFILYRTTIKTNKKRVSFVPKQYELIIKYGNIFVYIYLISEKRKIYLKSYKNNLKMKRKRKQICISAEYVVDKVCTITQN